MRLILLLLTALRSIFWSRAAVELEILALRHQIGVLQRAAKKRPKLTPRDRLLWVVLSRLWNDWRSALVIVKPETVIGWHRKGYRLFWGTTPNDFTPDERLIAVFVLHSAQSGSESQPAVLEEHRVNSYSGRSTNRNRKGP
jgi:hypothetical protein